MVKNSNRGAGGQKYKSLRVALHFHDMYRAMYRAVGQRQLHSPGKSIVPLLSASTSLIISCSSDSEGF